jgi:hypothetical protein
MSQPGTFASDDERKRSWVVKVFSAVIGSHREVPPRKRFDVRERLSFCQGANVALILVQTFLLIVKSKDNSINAQAKHQTNPRTQ